MQWNPVSLCGCYGDLLQYRSFFPYFSLLALIKRDFLQLLGEIVVPPVPLDHLLVEMLFCAPQSLNEEWIKLVDIVKPALADRSNSAAIGLWGFSGRNPPNKWKFVCQKVVC